MDFQVVLKRISPVLKRIIFKLNRECPLFSNDDLYQEALLHLWQEFQKGSLFDKTDSYILQGCFYYLKNYMRAKHRNVKLVSLTRMNEDEGQVYDLDNILPMESPESCREIIHCDMLIETINNNGFTKREKEVFSLSLEGLTTREIGARLGVSHVRVVKLKHNIKDKCRKYLDS